MLIPHLGIFQGFFPQLSLIPPWLSVTNQLGCTSSCTVNAWHSHWRQSLSLSTLPQGIQLWQSAQWQTGLDQHLHGRDQLLPALTRPKGTYLNSDSAAIPSQIFINCVLGSDWWCQRSSRGLSLSARHSTAALWFPAPPPASPRRFLCVICALCPRYCKRTIA